MTQACGEHFFSKILLFGEYSIIQQSMALAITYPKFSGGLVFRMEGDPLHRKVDRELKAFCDYLKQHPVGELFNLQDLEFDVEEGLAFASTIPQGFGVGSSAAVCASIFQRYTKNRPPESILELKSIFAQMESHFHGASSGFDPLVSYLNAPVLIDQKLCPRPVKLPDYQEGDGGLFLLNTGRARRTEPLVNLYLEKCKQSDFLNLCHNHYRPLTNKAITAFLEGDLESLHQVFNQISDWQGQHFRPMIPKLLVKDWELGRLTGDYALKLCGAGGGGFFLGMTRNFERVRELLPQNIILPLYRF